MVAVKICGLTEAQGVAASIEAGADYLGFVFAPNSPRMVTPAMAAALAETARAHAKIVAVLVNPGNKQLDKVVKQLRPNFIQLHGKESPDRVRTIWKRYHTPLIKACAVASAREVADVDRYGQTASHYLLDAKPPKGAAFEGGHGIAFDWNIIHGAALAKPWFLAGGLDAQNVGAAIAQTGARMVDVSSGVESAPGVKDPSKVAAFIKAAKSAGEQSEHA